MKKLFALMLLAALLSLSLTACSYDAVRRTTTATQAPAATATLTAAPAATEAAEPTAVPEAAGTDAPAGN